MFPCRLTTLRATAARTPMNSLILTILFSLGLTIAVEVAVAALLRVRGMDLVLIALINCLTNPLVNYIYHWLLWSFPRGSVVPYLCLGAIEAAVIFIEALLIWKMLRYRELDPVLLSLILNTVSFSIGEIIAVIQLLLRA